MTGCRQIGGRKDTDTRGCRLTGGVTGTGGCHRAGGRLTGVRTDTGVRGCRQIGERTDTGMTGRRQTEGKIDSTPGEIYIFLTLASRLPEISLASCNVSTVLFSEKYEKCICFYFKFSSTVNFFLKHKNIFIFVMNY